MLAFLGNSQIIKVFFGSCEELLSSTADPQRVMDPREEEGRKLGRSETRGKKESRRFVPGKECCRTGHLPLSGMVACTDNRVTSFLMYISPEENPSRGRFANFTTTNHGFRCIL